MSSATVAALSARENVLGRKLRSTISSPIQVHGVMKVRAKRAPELGEHNEEVLEELGFSAIEIDDLQVSGPIPHAKGRATATIG